MDLAELKFKVNTDELALAAKKIEALGDEITKLNAVQKSSTAIAKDEAQAEKVRIKSQTEMLELKQKLIDAEDKAAKKAKGSSDQVTGSANAVTRALEKQADVLKITRGQTIEVADGQLTLDRSFRSSQVSALASLKALGATTDQMSLFANTFKELNLAAGFNPLDKMSSGLVQLRQEVKEMSSVDALMRAGINLSRNTMVALSRDIEATTEAMKAEGKTFGDIEVVISNLTQEYKNLSQQKELSIRQSNEAAAAARAEAQAVLSAARGGKGPEQPMDQANLAYQKENARLMKESANAASYLEKEMKRVEFVLDETNATLQLSTSNRLLKFEESLKRTGVTGAQAGVQLDAYRQKLNKIDETRAFKRQTDDLKVYQDKVNYVTRAVGPQLTDIFSGLLTGQQSLYTIAVQQGGQLADQFSLAGIEANKMGGILASALPNMYTNIANIGKAFGQMAIGGFFQLGDAISAVALKTIPFGSNLTETTAKLTKLGESGGSTGRLIASSFIVISDAARFASAVLATTLIGSLLAFGVAAYQVMKEQNELSKALTLTGVSLGMSRDAAVQYAESLKSISGSKAIDALTEFAKAGVNSSESLETMIQAAIDLEKYGGVAIADTAKEIKKLQDEPLKALVDLAIATGKVTTETLEKAKAYAKAGDTVALLQLAEEEQARVAIENSGIMRDNLTSLERGVNNVTSAMKYLWEEFKSLARGGPIVDAIASALKLVAKVAVEVFFYVKSIALQMNGLSLLAISAIQDIGSANFDFSATKKAMSEIKTASATIVSERAAAMAQLEGTTKSVVSVTAEVAKAQSEAAKSVKANLDISQELDNKILQSSKKKLTQIEFENQAVEKYRKSLKGLASDESVVAKVRQVAAQEWKDSQTKPKADPSVKLLNQDLEKLTDTKNKALGLNKDYNNSEATLVRLLNQGHINLVEYTLAMSDLNAQQPRAIKLVQEQEKAQRELNKAWEDTVKAQAKNDDEYFKQFDELNKSKVELQNQNAEIDQQYSLLGKTEEQQKLITREYVKQNKLKAAQAELEADLRKITESNASNPESLQLEAYAKNAEKIKAINAGVALEFSQDMQREFNSIKATITDAVVTALFDGGKAGSKKLRDSIVAAFRNKITVVVDALVNTTMSSAASALGLGGKSQAGSAGSIAGGLSDLTSVMGAGLQAITGSIAGASTASLIGANTVGALGGDALGTLIAANGQWAGVSTVASAGATGALGSAAGAGSGLLSSVSAALPYIGLALGAVALLSDIFGSKKPKIQGLGQAGRTYSASGEVIGNTAVGGVYGGANAQTDAVLSAMNASYLSAAKALGVTAVEQTYGYGANVMSDGGNPNFRVAGGGFNSGETAYDEAAFNLAMGKVLLSSIKSSTLPKYLQGAFDSVDIAKLTQEQLTAVMTGVQSLKAFSDQMRALPFVSLQDLTYTATQNLLAFSGGIEKFSETLSSYYENFYTAEEKSTILTNNVAASFSKLGIELPKIDENTRGWYRGVVETAMALDQGIAANALYTSGILSLQGAVNELAPAFTEVETTIVELVDTTVESMKELKEAMTALLASMLTAATEGVNLSLSSVISGLELQKTDIQTAYETQADIISTSLETVADSISKLQSLSSTLKSTLDSMKLSGSGGTERRSAQAEIKAALLLARTSGVLPTDGSLDKALNAVSEPSEQLFSTFADYARDFYYTANDIASLGDLTDKQLTDAQITNDLLEDQSKTLDEGYKKEIKRLDDLIKEAQNQVDAVLKVNTSVMSLSDALDRFVTTLTASINDQLINDYELIDLNKSSGVDMTEFLAKFGDMANSSVLTSIFNTLDADGNLQISNLEAIKGNTAALLNALQVQGTGGSSAGAASYSGAQIKAGIDAMKTAGFSDAQIIAAGSTQYGVSSSDIAKIAGITGDTGLVDYQKQVDAAVALTQPTRESIITQAQAMASAMGISPERALYDYARSAGINAATVDKLMGYPNGTSNAWALANGLPAFKNGGSYQGGMALVGEEGPELINFNKPGQVYTASQTRGIMNDSRLEELVIKLNENIEGLRFEVRADVSHNSKIAKILDRVSPDGQSLSVTVV